MSANAIARKYYELLIKLYKNVNNENIKWSKAINAEFFTAEINYKFKMRIYKSVDNLASNYIFRMYDDGGIKVFEITSEENGRDEVLVDDKTMTISDILEEIYEWARAYSLDIVEKVDQASEMLDALMALTKK
ncbi:MAG: hypothetical protein GY839_05835 [candidate division Zixibacteria bacterium]|nr:hypothetical protein [candidate division Zixibacteria bacterium]